MLSLDNAESNHDDLPRRVDRGNTAGGPPPAAHLAFRRWTSPAWGESNPSSAAGRVDAGPQPVRGGVAPARVRAGRGRRRRALEQVAQAEHRVRDVQLAIVVRVRGVPA